MLYFISIQIHFLVVMKGFRTLLCVISLALSGVIVSDVMAQKELGVFNSLAVGVGVGTTGHALLFFSINFVCLRRIRK